MYVAFSLRPTIIDPTPAPVKTSSSRASGARPSMMCVRSTPPVAARMQASTLAHPAGQRPARHQLGEVIRIGEGHQRGAVVPVAQHSGHGGQEDQFHRPERHCHRLRHGVGVDVVYVAVAVTGEARDYRHEAAVEEGRDHARVDPGDITYVTVIDRPLDPVVVHHAHRRTPARREQVAIDPGESHRLDLVLAECRDQVGVERAGEGHLDRLERGGVGDPPPRHHLRLLAEPALEVARLGAAAVDHHETDAEGVEERQLTGHVVERGGVLEHITAELHDEGLVAVGAYVAEGALEAGDAFAAVDHRFTP